jgi:hypothetical protein
VIACLSTALRNSQGSRPSGDTDAVRYARHTLANVRHEPHAAAHAATAAGTTATITTHAAATAAAAAHSHAAHFDAVAHAAGGRIVGTALSSELHTHGGGWQAADRRAVCLNQRHSIERCTL